MKSTKVIVGAILASVMLALIVVGGGVIIGSVAGFSTNSTSLASATDCTDNAALSLAPVGNVQLNTAGVEIDNEPLDQTQIQDAQDIVGVASSMGLSYRDALVGLMVGMQEAHLENPDYGDQDSLGLFQQRPSQGWGTADEVINPVYAANKFFQTLVQVPNRNGLSLIQEAIDVQHPNAADYEATFDDWLPIAQQLLGNNYQPSNSATTPQSVALDTGCPAGGSDSSLPGLPGTTSALEIAIQAGMDQIGTPYVWGGVTPSTKDPSTGNIIRGGFDCSGLMQWMFAQAGITLPRVAADQFNTPGAIHITDPADLQRGDLVFWALDAGSSEISHVAMYMGNNQILQAPETGMDVGIYPMFWDGYQGAIQVVPTGDDVTVDAVAQIQGWELPIAQGQFSMDVDTPDGLVFTTKPKHTASVRAVRIGIVTAITSDPFNGTAITITHPGYIRTQYANLADVAFGLTVGSKVKEGQVIGTTGSSGAGLGTRLQFRVAILNKTVDALQYLQKIGIAI